MSDSTPLTFSITNGVPPRYHDAIHVIRQPVVGKRLEYVAAVLSEEPPALNFIKLGKELDSIIAKQTP